MLRLNCIFDLRWPGNFGILQSLSASNQRLARSPYQIKKHLNVPTRKPQLHVLAGGLSEVDALHLRHLVDLQN